MYKISGELNLLSLLWFAYSEIEIAGSAASAFPLGGSSLTPASFLAPGMVFLPGREDLFCRIVNRCSAFGTIHFFSENSLDSGDHLHVFRLCKGQGLAKPGRPSGSADTVGVSGSIYP